MTQSVSSQEADLVFMHAVIQVILGSMELQVKVLLLGSSLDLQHCSCPVKCTSHQAAEQLSHNMYNKQGTRGLLTPSNNLQNL